MTETTTDAQPQTLGVAGIASTAAVGAQPSRTLYRHLGDGPIVAEAWPTAGVTLADGTPLYYFTGDANPGDTNGASDQWEVVDPSQATANYSPSHAAPDATPDTAAAPAEQPVEQPTAEQPVEQPVEQPTEQPDTALPDSAAPIDAVSDAFDTTVAAPTGVGLVDAVYTDDVPAPAPVADVRPDAIAVTIPDNYWVESDPGHSTRLVAAGGLVINGTPLHLEAIQVSDNGDSLYAVDPANELDVDAIYTIGGDGGKLATLQIGSGSYLLVATPYQD